MTRALPVVGLLLCLGCPSKPKPDRAGEPAREAAGSGTKAGTDGATPSAGSSKVDTPPIGAAGKARRLVRLEPEVAQPRRTHEMMWNDPADDPELVDDYFSEVSEHDGASDVVAPPRPTEVGGSRSRSIGPPNAGWLVRGVEIPPRGRYHRVLRGTVARRWNYGTDALVALIQEAAKAVHDQHKGPPLRVGNLSRAEGGKITPSVSHQSGRDADIGIYATDLDGVPVDAPGFPKFNGARGALLDTTGNYLFDVKRNWEFVAALLRTELARIQWVFLDTPLKEALLDYAVRTGADPKLIDRAEKVIVRPANSSPHANHYHIRIFCTDADTADPIAPQYACRDYGPEWEWVKKERENSELLLQDQLDRIMRGELDLNLAPTGAVEPVDSGAPTSPEQLRDPPTDIEIKL